MAILLRGTLFYKWEYVFRMEFVGRAFHVEYWCTKCLLIIVKGPYVVRIPAMKGFQSFFMAADSLKPLCVNIAIHIFRGEITDREFLICHAMVLESIHNVLEIAMMEGCSQEKLFCMLADEIYQLWLGIRQYCLYLIWRNKLLDLIFWKKGCFAENTTLERMSNGVEQLVKLRLVNLS